MAPQTKPPGLVTIWSHVLMCAVIVTFLSFVVVLSGYFGVLNEFKVIHTKEKFSGRTIILNVHLISMDPLLAIMDLQWLIMNDTACHANTANASAPDCSRVDIFFDTNLAASSDGSGPTQSNEIQTKPIFIWNPVNANNVHANAASFKTSITVTPTRSLMFYPWDGYITEIVMEARVSNTTEPVGVKLDIANGGAVGFNVAANPNPGLGEDPIPPELFFQAVSIKRGPLVIAYTVIIVLAVWIISLIFVFGTVMSIGFGHTIGPEFLAIPIGTLFTVAALRTTFPGAPGVGTIMDYVGTMPCLAILALCATLTIGRLGVGDFDKPRVPIFSRLRNHWSPGKKLADSESSYPMVQTMPIPTPVADDGSLPM